MQVHRLSLEVEAPPDVVWALFWSHRSGSMSYEDVTIDILHPGDASGEGLIRHATFPVPRYLLTGGAGESWEWLTHVTPPVSWRYDAVGGPPWSRAEGRTTLEGLDRGRTRIIFEERYLVNRTIPRLLFEARVHRFLSRNNDRLMRDGIEAGVRAVREAATPGGS